ncbi:hypothetical protein ACF0H5_009260 [Mactra antiquata]
MVVKNGVVNISRQQKAVCNREIEKLRGLEKYFNRQNHIESYKQSSEIDKFRAKLVRLNNLRMLSESENKRSGTHFFPITKSSRRQYIGNSTSTTNYNKGCGSVERNANLTKRTYNSSFDTKFGVLNKGYINSSVNHESNYTNPTLQGLIGEAKFKIKTCQRVVNSKTVLRHSLRSDKQAINYTKRQPRLNNKLLDVNITSVTPPVISDKNINQFTDLSNTEIVSTKNRKNVRFNEQTETFELNKNLYDGRKFTQLVKLANSISGK